MGLDIVEAGAAQQCAHRVALVPAVLQQQPAAREQMRGRIADDGADRVETVQPRRQRRFGFVTQRIQMRITDRDVRRIAGDQIEAFAEGGRQAVIDSAKVIRPIQSVRGKS